MGWTAASPERVPAYPGTPGDGKPNVEPAGGVRYARSGSNTPSSSPGGTVMSENRQSDPSRVVRTATIEVNASPDEAFPLFTPLGEGLWSEDWDPVFRHPPEAELEEGAVFTTPDGPDGDRVWTILEYRPKKHRIAYLCVSPGMVHSRIEIDCEGTELGTSKVEVTYTDTALSEKGQAHLGRESEEVFSDRVGHWEHAINAYLRSGGTRT